MSEISDRQETILALIVREYNETAEPVGSKSLVEHYNLMGPVKAALEASARYMAAELGGQGIRVHAISPGPVRTRAAR